MMDAFEQLMDSIVRGTLGGICLGFWILCIVAIWKWFIGVMKRGLFYLFPGLETWVQNKRKMRIKDNGIDNDTEPSGGPDRCN